MSDEPKLRYFNFEHLPEGLLRDVSHTFNIIANDICTSLPPSAERSLVLNELKIAKDWAVVAAVDVVKAAGDTITGKERAGIDSPDLSERQRKYDSQVASCPTPGYHETHRYCPSCPWNEEGVLS